MKFNSKALVLCLSFLLFPWSQAQVFDPEVGAGDGGGRVGNGKRNYDIFDPPQEGGGRVGNGQRGGIFAPVQSGGGGSGGGRVGNGIGDFTPVTGYGGAAVVCRDPRTAKITSATFYDRYESENDLMGAVPFDLGLPEFTVEQKIDLALLRLKRFDPGRAKMYKEWAMELFDPDFRNFVRGPLPMTANSKEKELALETNCKIERVVLASPPRFREEKYYSINKEIWDFMTLDTREGRDNLAVAALHAAVEREVSEYIHVSDTVGARYFLSKFTEADKFNDQLMGDKSSIEGYLTLLRDAGFQSFEYGENVFIEIPRYFPLFFASLDKVLERDNSKVSPVLDRNIEWVDAICRSDIEGSAPIKLIAHNGAIDYALGSQVGDAQTDFEHLYPNRNGVTDWSPYLKNLPPPFTKLEATHAMKVRPFWIKSENEVGKAIQNYIVLVGVQNEKLTHVTDFNIRNPFTTVWKVRVDLSGKSEDIRIPYKCKKRTDI